MSDPVRLERRSGIAVITINSPPVNALGAAVRKGLADTVAEAVEDETVKAIAIEAAGRTFPVGADISEFDSPPAAPELATLCNIIEASPKPVIVALHGTVLGGGLELAMAAHYRIAHKAARFGLPEVALGLLPGGGGTQRTPRLIGADAALEMMMSGTPIGANEAKAKGLIDEIAEGSLDDLLMMRAGQITQPRPTRDLRKHLRMGSEFMSQIGLWRAELGELIAHRKIVDCVEASLLLPFDAALEMEREAFRECLDSSSSKGLRHAFMAERRASKFPELAHAHPLPVETIAVLGHSEAACKLASGFLSAGLTVSLVAGSEQGISEALDLIGAHFQAEAKSGRITEGQGADALTHLKLTTDPLAGAKADCVIDCLDAETSERTLQRISPHLSPEVVVASTDATRDIAKLGAACEHKNRVVLMHLPVATGPVQVIELGVSGKVDHQVLATAHALVKRLGKFPVRSAAKPGLIGLTMQAAYREACDRLLLQGASPDEVDGAMRDFGMRLGPYEMLDHEGLDVVSQRRKARLQPVALALVDTLANAGWNGLASGRGYYRYDNASGAQLPNRDMLQLLDEERIARDVRPEEISPSRIRKEVLLAMINTGARLVDQGVAMRPSDIDAVMIHGFGYPRLRGGPMHEADQLTTFEVFRKIETLATEEAQVWEPSPLLVRLARERLSFDSLNQS